MADNTTMTINAITMSEAIRIARAADDGEPMPDEAVRLAARVAADCGSSDTLLTVMANGITFAVFRRFDSPLAGGRWTDMPNGGDTPTTVDWGARVIGASVTQDDEAMSSLHDELVDALNEHADDRAGWEACLGEFVGGWMIAVRACNLMVMGTDEEVAG